jgi:DNA-binding response OmpR family regulator
MRPSFSGIENLREMRPAGVTPPILILTAKGDVEDELAGMDIGLDDLLVKLFPLAEILVRIGALPRGVAAGLVRRGFAQAQSTCSKIEEPVQKFRKAKNV